jgi:hypothetical protein
MTLEGLLTLVDTKTDGSVCTTIGDKLAVLEETVGKLAEVTPSSEGDVNSIGELSSKIQELVDAQYLKEQIAGSGKTKDDILADLIKGIVGDDDSIVSIKKYANKSDLPCAGSEQDDLAVVIDADRNFSLYIFNKQEGECSLTTSWDEVVIGGGNGNGGNDAGATATAEEAKTIANEAKTTAESAQTTAESAKATANAANSLSIDNKNRLDALPAAAETVVTSFYISDSSVLNNLVTNCSILGVDNRTISSIEGVITKNSDAHYNISFKARSSFNNHTVSGGNSTVEFNVQIDIPQLIAAIGDSRFSSFTEYAEYYGSYSCEIRLYANHLSFTRTFSSISLVYSNGTFVQYGSPSLYLSADADASRAYFIGSIDLYAAS